jgi:hypothetical protein
MTTRGLALLFGAWVVGLGVGVYEMYAYATTPGVAETAPSEWPDDTTLVRDPDAPTIVMFVNPDCPCSRASLAELAQVRVALPRVHTVITNDETEMARFGARTSGYVAAYDAAGRLRFSGGITGSRGHQGDNAGRETLIAVLTSADRTGTHAVFGCALGAP